MSNFLRQKNTGFTLVETLVAISIFTLSILALMSVLTQGISNTSYAKQKIIASYLAQEGVEYIRNMRDNYVLYPVNGTWNNFKNKLAPCNQGSNQECGFNNLVLSTNSAFIFKCSSGDCKLYLNNGSYNTNSSGVYSGFIRKIWMTTVPANPDEVKIFSNVSWTQGSGSYSITFSESLFNWVE